jgi:hypothetical protein
VANVLIIFILIFRTQSSSHDLCIRYQKSDKVIIDCNYTFDEAVSGLEIPKSILQNLAIENVEYFSFDGKIHKGQVVVNKTVVKDIKEIFEFIKKTKFPINKVIPIVNYKWSDEASMNDNNTSAFNYRKVKGQKVLSPHANGLAIDINPMQNPLVKKKETHPNKSYIRYKNTGNYYKRFTIS